MHKEIADFLAPNDKRPSFEKAYECFDLLTDVMDGVTFSKVLDDLAVTPAKAELSLFGLLFAR